MRLDEAWEGVAADWVSWARAPGHDSYWQFHRERFFELVPPPGDLTIDIGCGEGRVSRALKALGHRVIAVDASPTMIAAARETDPDGDYRLADAAVLPFDDECADLVLAFMSFQDVDDMPGPSARQPASSGPEPAPASPSSTRSTPAASSRVTTTARS